MNLSRRRAIALFSIGVALLLSTQGRVFAQTDMTGFWKFSIPNGGLNYMELKQTGETIASVGRRPMTGTLHDGKLHLAGGTDPNATVYDATVKGDKFPAGVVPTRDLRLRVRYTGDVLRAYHGDKLLDDDFYNARPFEIGLRRYGPPIYQDGLLLKILPLREDAPIYITDRSQLKFDSSTHAALTLEGVEVIEMHEVRLIA